MIFFLWRNVVSSLLCTEQAKNISEIQLCYVFINRKNQADEFSNSLLYKAATTHYKNKEQTLAVKCVDTEACLNTMM